MPASKLDALNSMKKEIYFERRWKTYIQVFVVFLVLQIVGGLVLRKLWVDNQLENKILDFLFYELVCLVIVGILIYPLVMQRYLRFYEEGISFIKFFGRTFISWAEIIEISNVSRNQHPVIRLQSKLSKVDIMLSEYKEQTKLIEYIEMKTSKRFY